MNWYTDFNDLMMRGGPVMWVIFITAWLAIVMLCERAIQVHIWLSHAVKDQTALEKKTHNLPAVVQGIRRASPVNTVLHRLQWHNIEHRENIAKQINIHLTELMPKLEGVLPTIAVLGTLLPMLGLLGTVTGMIEVFEVIALHGTGNPQEMANGISQALFPPEVGLCISLPGLILLRLTKRRVVELDAFLAQVESYTVQFMRSQSGLPFVAVADPGAPAVPQEPPHPGGLRAMFPGKAALA